MAVFVYILSVSVDPQEMSWTEAALAQAPLCDVLNLKDLLKPLFVMWLFKNLNLS